MSAAESVAQLYRNLAPEYDLLTAAGQSYRERAVATLAPPVGSVVLDVGCGTGLNFEGLEDEIGPHGHLVGIDVSPDMLALARERVERHCWENVTLIEASAEDVALGDAAEAALLSAVHDILRSRRALTNIVRQVRPGGRVVAAGPKWVPWCRPESLALNSYTRMVNRQYVTTFEGFEAPWSHLARLLGNLTVEETFFGGGFVAVGTRPSAPPEAFHCPARLATRNGRKLRSDYARLHGCASGGQASGWARREGGSHVRICPD